MKIHIAQKGETLWNIAKKYGVDFQELKKLNAQLSNPDMIMPGMKIKVPGTGTAPKKEMPIQHHHHVPKEMPKAEHPFVQKKEAPVPVVKPPKEVPKEKPQQIYQPIMPQPQPLPEIDINNYYMMNLQQLQAQVQQPAPPKEVVHHEEPTPSPEKPVMPQQEIPIQGGATLPMFFNNCYPMPVMPICDPCYPGVQQPYQMQMMPQVQGTMTGPVHMPPYQQMYQPMAQPMPMYTQQQMPTVLPGVAGVGHEATYNHWDDESPSSSYHHMTGMQYQQGNEAVMGVEQSFNPYQEMPVQGYQQPFAPMPFMPNFAQAGGDCGCGGPAQVPFSGYPAQGQGQALPFTAGPQFQGYPMNPYGTAMPYPTASYAMPTRHDDGIDDE